MAEDWTCHVCGTAVSWGAVTCPLCGSALNWEEEDEDDPLAVLMPVGWDDDDAAGHRPGVRWYAAGAIALGLILAFIGLASGGVRPGLLLLGGLLIAAGGYGLVRQPKRFQ